MRRSALLMVMVALALAALACEREQVSSTMPPDPGSAPAPRDGGPTDAAPRPPEEPLRAFLASEAQAQVIFKSRADHEVEGALYFLEVKDGILVIGTIRGLSAGVRAIHIHELGDCSAPDFESAGAHYDPTDAPHGPPFAENRHLGDMGNLITNEQGVADFGLRLTRATLAPGPTSILEKSVIVHERADDYETQPTGDAGGRVACGIIVPTGDPRGD